LHPRFLRFDYCWKRSIVLPRAPRGKHIHGSAPVAMS
jgi:hypothetical protein